jgi:hypothetical protein
MNGAPSGMNDGEQMAGRRQVITGVKLETEGLFPPAIAAFLSSFSPYILSLFSKRPGSSNGNSSS